MQKVKPKKRLGQHFLNDQRVAQRIVESLDASQAETVLEVGPGMGVLTQHLAERYGEKFYAVEIDAESLEYLKTKFPVLGKRLLHLDFLQYDLQDLASSSIAIIGNFPYNISSQIFFKILDNRNHVTEVVGMLQREVAQRICEPPGSRTYGILSVLLQAFFDIKYLFTVSEGVFTPPPKVKSAVIKLSRNKTTTLSCNETLFFKVVKAGFNHRRKTLRNSLSSAFQNISSDHPKLSQRAEQLSVNDFVELTNFIESCSTKT